MKITTIKLAAGEYTCEHDLPERSMSAYGKGIDGEDVCVMIWREKREKALSVQAYGMGCESIFAGMEDLIASSEGFTYGDIDPGEPAGEIATADAIYKSDLEKLERHFLEIHCQRRAVKQIPPGQP